MQKLFTTFFSEKNSDIDVSQGPKCAPVFAIQMYRSNPPGVFWRNGFSENMLWIYRRTLMLKCDFKKVTKRNIEITLRYGCFPVNLLHIFRTPFPKNTYRTPFPKNTSEGPLLNSTGWKYILSRKQFLWSL